MAGQEDGLPYAKRSQTPDLQGAGMPAVSAPSAGLLDMLGGPGNMSAMMGLLAAPPSQTGTYAAALSGGISAMRGQPDPVQQIQQNTQRQQNVLGTMFQRMQTEQRIAAYQQQNLLNEKIRLDQGERRLQEEVKNHAATREQARDSALMTILKPLETHKEFKQREMYWNQISPIVQKMGGPDLRPSAAVLAERPLADDEKKMILGFRDANPEMPMSAQEIAERTGLDPKSITAYLPIADSDAARNATGVPTKAAGLAKRAEEDKKALDFVREKYGLSEKNPQTPFALQYTMTEFHTPFHQASLAQQTEALNKATILSTKAEKLTPHVREALALYEPYGDPQDPTVVQRALNRSKLRDQQDKVNIAAMTGQLAVAGQIAGAELKRVDTQHSTFAGVESLARQAERLIDEGRRLNLSGNAPAINTIEQGFKYATGGPESEAAQWYRAWNTLDARFAQVAKALEGISGNRLATANVERALSFHPKRQDPYGTQIRVLGEMKGALEEARQNLDEDTAGVLQRHKNVLAGIGAPSLLEQGAARAQPSRATPLNPTTPPIGPSPRPGMIRVRLKSAPTGEGYGWLDPTDLSSKYEAVK